MNKFQQRQHDRRTHLEAHANKVRSASQIVYIAAKQMALVIPFGQPALGGHHSESPDRRYRERIHKTFGKSFVLAGHADELDRRAAAVGKGGISGDDPDAVAKLRTQLVVSLQEQPNPARSPRCSSPTPSGWKAIRDASRFTRTPCG